MTDCVYSERHSFNMLSYQITIVNILDKYSAENPQKSVLFSVFGGRHTCIMLEDRSEIR